MYDCPHCQKPIADAMPKHRFDEVNSALGESKKLLAEAQKGAAVSEQLAKQVAELQGQAAARDAAHAREMAFAGAGLADPSVREVFGLHFDRQAGAGEKDAAKWLQTLAADPAKAPPVLAALLPKPAAPGAPVLPNTAGAKAPAGAPPALSAEQIQKMSPAEFAKSWGAIAAANPELKLPPALPWGDAPKAA